MTTQFEPLGPSTFVERTLHVYRTVRFGPSSLTPSDHPLYPLLILNQIKCLVIESKHEGSKQPIITRKHGAGGPKKSQKPQSNVFYSEYSKSFFNLTYFPETSAWNITSNGPLKMPIKIKVRISVTWKLSRVS